MKNKRKRRRRSVEARLVLNDWQAVGHTWLEHRLHGCVYPLRDGEVRCVPWTALGPADSTPLHERRGNDFWLTANYVIKKGWA